MNEEPFCMHHDDTEQARTYHEAESDAQSDSIGIEMDTTCESCGTALHRRERLTEHPNMGGRLVFEAYVACDCSEHVLGVQSARTTALPTDWQ